MKLRKSIQKQINYSNDFVVNTYRPTWAQTTESAQTAALLNTLKTELEGGNGLVGLAGVRLASSSGPLGLPNEKHAPIITAMMITRAIAPST